MRLRDWDGAAFRHIDDVPMAEHEEAFGWEPPGPERAARTNGPTKTIWVTKDGTRIRVRDMDDSHLVNTVRYLLRTVEHMRQSYLSSMYGFATFLTSEMAQDAIDREIGAVEDMDAYDFLEYAGPPTWPALLREVDRRDLGDRLHGGGSEGPK